MISRLHPTFPGLATFVLALAVQGCAPPASPTEAIAVPTSTAVGESAPAQPPSPLNEAAIALEGLTSYQASLDVAITGTQGGRPIRWDYSVERTFGGDPAVDVLTLETTGLAEGQDNGGTILVRADDHYFARWSSFDPCVRTEWEAMPGFFGLPAELLPDLSGAERVGADEVDGLPADRFVLSGTAGIITGMVWTATEGGFLLEAQLQQDGALTAFGSDVKGHAEWQYHMTAINAPLEPILPLSCRHLLGGLPLPEDVAQADAWDDRVGYVTSLTSAEVIAFYDTEMAANGWTNLGAPLTSETSAFAIYVREFERLAVLSTTGEGVTSVTLIYSSPAGVGD